MQRYKVFLNIVKIYILYFIVLLFLRKLLKNIGELYDKLPLVNIVYNLTVKQKYLTILFFIVLGYIYLILKELPDPNNHFTVCLFKNITKYPCPACGTTRGMVYIINGYFLKAILMNPLSYLTIMGTIVVYIWILRDLITKKESLFPFIKQKAPAWFIVLVILLTIANGIWNVYKGL